MSSFLLPTGSTLLDSPRKCKTEQFCETVLLMREFFSGTHPRAEQGTRIRGREREEESERLLPGGLILGSITKMWHLKYYLLLGQTLTSLEVFSFPKGGPFPQKYHEVV
jgi:hypothetical protein